MTLFYWFLYNSYINNIEICFRLNHCDIINLIKWIKKLQNCCPNLKYLSLLGNPCNPLFNGRTVFEANDYRMYVIGQMQSLAFLDDQIITAANRIQAKSHRFIHGLASAFHLIGGGPSKSTSKNRPIPGRKVEVYEYTTTDWGYFSREILY